MPGDDGGSVKKFDVPPPAKLVCGILYGQELWLEKTLVDLRTEFGEIDFQSESLEFHFTDYYAKEMGRPLFRIFVGFTRLIDPSELPMIKILTNSLEEKYATSASGSRVVN